MKISKKILYSFIIIYLFLIPSLTNAKLIGGKGCHYVIATTLFVRSQPNVNSKILKKISLGESVIIKKKSGRIETIGKVKGEWVFIDTRQARNYSTRETVKGWVFNYYLSDLSEFKKVKNFGNYTLDLKSHDIPFSYVFKKNGEFIHKYFDYESNKFLERKGEIYQYRNIYIAEAESGRLFLVKLKNGDIISDSSIKLKKR